MTNIVDMLNASTETVQQNARTHGYKKGIEAINLAAIFQARGITFGADNGNITK